MNIILGEIVARYLDSDGLKSEISRILKRSNEFIYLVSPYIKLTDRYKELIRDITNNVEVHIIYGKKELKDDLHDWLKSTKNISVHYRENLHAKCYMNEKMAIITSLNLYESSLVNNIEMGIAIYKDQDPEIYKEILLDVQQLFRLSQTKLTPKSEYKTDKPVPTEFWCIRCGEPIPSSNKTPYCKKCIKTWNRYKNPDYREKNGVCLICGNPYESSMNDPICPDCQYDFNIESFFKKYS